MVKSNYIIEASYKLNLQEQKIIYLLTTKIEKDDTDFKPYKFTQVELNKALGKNLTLKELCDCIDILKKKELKIKKENSLLNTGWLSSSEYFKNGIIELEFSPKLKPYLLQLKERFTKLLLSQMMCFDSQYSCRIYELLKQYENVGERTLSINLLRDMFLIQPTQYRRYNDFKRKVILKAHEEINQKSDIWFDFEEIKTGRKVTSIKFIIHSKAKDEISMTSETIEEINIKNIQAVKFIIEEDITALEARKILDAAVGDLEKIKEKYLLAKDTNNIKNIVAWLIKALKEDWQPQKGKVKENNFKGRNYNKKDIENIEKALLGYE